MKLRLKIRIAAGIVLILAGFLVGLWDFLTPLTTLQDFLVAQSIAWVLTVSGFVVLLFRTSQDPVTRGVVLVLAAPLVGFLIFTWPVKGLFFLPLLGVGVIALYGIFSIISGLGERRRAREIASPSMLPESQPSRNTVLGAGSVMVALGLVLVLLAGFGRAPFGTFGYTLGFVLLGFGVVVIVAGFARSRMS